MTSIFSREYFPSIAASYFLVLSLGFPSDSWALNYVAQRLATLGGASSTGTAINSSGQVVGTSYLADNATQRAFITGPNGHNIRDLGTLGGDQSFAYGVNDFGQVAGSAMQGLFQVRAFLTGPNGDPMANLGVFGEGNASRATSVNVSGQAAGDSLTEIGINRRAFITAPAFGGLRDIGDLGPALGLAGSRVFATGINAGGQVVGYAAVTLPRIGPGITRLTQHAFITGPNGMGIRNLGPADGPVSYAYGINDSGQVVGSSNGVAFRTGPNGTNVEALGTLGGQGSEALSINRQGWVVGRSLTATGNWHAFAYGIGGSFIHDLNSIVTLGSGDYLTSATGINDSGAIVVNSALGTAFLLSPIPEPATSLYIIMGGGFLYFMKRKTRRFG